MTTAPVYGLPVNVAKEELEYILHSLSVPPNYRVVLSVERNTEMLRLAVHKDEPWALRVRGRIIFRSNPNWDDPKTLQRHLSARTYESLLAQVKESPEFFEFELVIDGDVRYREASVFV